MKIYAFEVREDELQDFENVKQRYNVEKQQIAADLILII